MANTLNKVELTAIVEDWFHQFEAALRSGDGSKASALFSSEGYWRDLLTLTWDFRTLKGRNDIEQYLSQAAKTGENLITHLKPDGETTFLERFSWIQCAFTFETSIAQGKGVVRLSQEPVNEKWLAFTFYTGIEELKGYPEHAGLRGSNDTRGKSETSSDLQSTTSSTLRNRDPEVLIIGGGQAGLTLAARLGRLDVDTLIIERAPRVGDNWRNRYDSLALHDTLWRNHLPYFPFPKTWPVFPHKDMVADWLETYAKAMGLDIWTSSTIHGQPKYDEGSKRWTVAVVRPDGSTITLRPNHLVLATSLPGEANVPAFKGSEDFKGPIMHSAQFRSSKDYAQKKVAVIGCGNSSLDVARDLYEHGAEPTVVQRSSTLVISSDAVFGILQKGLYERDGPPVDVDDLLSFSFPFAVTKAISAAALPKIKEFDGPMLEGLEKAGFKLDDGPDGAGLLAKIFMRGGGYYIDVGCAKLIAEGKVMIKQGREVDHLNEDGIVFDDGSELKADAIVLATGFKGMKNTVAKLLGEDIAAQTPRIGGLDKEGEMNGLWRATGHPHLWFHGGNLLLCRFWSKRVALQIKAQQAGIWKV